VSFTHRERRRQKCERLVAAALVFAATLVTAQNDWAYFGQDQGGTKYSTLTQINTGNVSSLRRA